MKRKYAYDTKAVKRHRVIMKRKRKLLFLLVLSVLFTPCIATGSEKKQEVPSLSFDRKHRKDRIPNFRIAQKPFKQSSKGKPTSLGLDGLRASASGQPTEREILTLKKQLSPNGKLVLVDLRQECHGYINGEPFHWKNGGVSIRKANMISIENQLLADLDESQAVTIRERSRSVNTVNIHSKHTETETAQKYGILSLRLPTRHAHGPPSDVLETFIDFVDHLDSDAWVHLHCREGHSRATMYFIMFDILHNAHQVSLNDIIVRHHLLGAPDFSKDEELEKQYLFLKEFYCFAKGRFQGETRSWSQFSKDNHLQFLPAVQSSSQEKNKVTPLSQVELKRLKDVFSQTFYFLGEGQSSLAYESEDQKYILKFFKPRNDFGIDYVMERLAGYRLADRVHKEQTGILFLHLEETNDLNIDVSILDKKINQKKIKGMTKSVVPLDKVAFVLQKKANKMSLILKDSINRNDDKLVRKRLRQVFDLYEIEIDKGLVDLDPKIINNFGFIEENPVRFDVSHLREIEKPLNPEKFQQFKSKMEIHVNAWLAKNHLESHSEIWEEVEKGLTRVTNSLRAKNALPDGGYTGF